jgi:hypothetical protein
VAPTPRELRGAGPPPGRRVHRGARDNHRGVVGGMSADRCDRAQPRR